VADDASKHATVPDRVGPSADVAGIDSGAGGIADATETEEQKRQRWNDASHLVSRADEQPSDGEIEADKGAVMGLGQEELEGNARQRERPNPGEQAFAKRAANARGKGRVCAGDELEERRMIEIPQQRTPLCRLAGSGSGRGGAARMGKRGGDLKAFNCRAATLALRFFLGHQQVVT
jgi:hypothetical protein